MPVDDFAGDGLFLIVILNLVFCLPIPIAYFLDLLLGDSEKFWHPIRSIGKLISFLENQLRKAFPKNKGGEFSAGLFLVIITVGLSSLVSFTILLIAFKINFALGLIIDSILCYYLLSVRSLRDESMKVYYPLKSGNLPMARQMVSRIVGRDTENLDEKGVTKATVETIAENTADGIIAPMLYMAIGGSVLGYAYKAINTMDSMVAYKNDKYINFGKCAAKLDDIVNFVPARLAAFFMLLSCIFLKLDVKNAFRIFKRDRYKHASPNSAQTEAVCAGALGIMLAGNAYYFGKLYEKEYIGDEIREIEIEDIKRANAMLYVTSFLFMMFSMILRFLILWGLLVNLPNLPFL